MDLEIKKKIYKKKKVSSNYLSIWFLIFSIVLTMGLYFYNMSIVSQNEELDNNITIKVNSIEELEKDSDIIALSLYNANESSISKLEDYSKISSYINHIIKLKWIYGISFKWFTYSSWKLSSVVTASSDSIWNINYKKVVRFIEEYRKNEDSSALFNLDLVNNVTTKNDWIDNIFNIDLTLKNNISKIFEEAEFKKIEIKKQEELNKIERLEEEKARKQAIADKLKIIKENVANTAEKTLGE